ncbi:unnamed protein product [Caenorhabditis auriculariae]|uniref:peroxidase n=1 Tax=Caenorhabditis auriculariae TaxID=2777116 RepID=A0A8S1H413_9PELO|nr:unnamed protein product [Caenorhabditis auriculariae]
MSISDPDTSKELHNVKFILEPFRLPLCIMKLLLPPPLLLFIPGILAQTLSPPITDRFKCLTNGCCDQHEWCRFWASIGECNANHDWMTEKLSIGLWKLYGAACFSTPDTSDSAHSNHCSYYNSNVDASYDFAWIDGGSTDIKPVTSCEQVVPFINQAAEVMAVSKLVNPVEDNFGRNTLSLDDVTRSVSSGCVIQLSQDGVDCNKNLCYHLMYRSFDGTCNNLEKPMQGAAFRQFIRHFPSEYDDGKGEPISSLKETRPPAREANRVMLSSAQSVVHDKFNNMMMQWGQFMSHDMAKTTLQPSAQCKTCDPIPSKCMAIPINDKDPNAQFKSKQCLKVSRSAPICQVEPREQLNENTAYIDASMIYGSSPKDLHKFREGRTGLLKLTRFNDQIVLPFDQAKCVNKEKCTASFTAGDIRANLFIGLSSLHILFAREHNRIAQKMMDMNSAWSGDRVFQETRKIVGAVVQNILYKEYLPKLLGVSLEKIVGSYKGYDKNVDATIANEFTTSAFRFGHGMIEEFYKRVDFSGGNITDGGFSFGDGVFKSGKILFEGGIDPILRGFMATAVKRPHRMTPAITEKMFGSTDLGSLNIQRGRDHGIPPYNKMRTFCGLKRAEDFEDFGDMILDKNLRIGLSKNYNTTDDVDFYVGAMLEDPVVGGLVGTTLSCVIGEQFKRLRDGDRFYFENPGIFTPEQVDQLKKASLSRVICDNGDHFELISQDAFLQTGSQMSSCKQLPEVDLTAWKA